MKTGIIPAACLALLATAASAQVSQGDVTPATPAPPSTAAPAGQQINVTGTVKEFALTPAGDIEGLLLTNGTEVHVPPHLTAQIGAAVRPGESVAIRGWSTGIPNFLIASALTGQGGQSVVDQGPPPRGLRPPPPPRGQPLPGAQQTTIQGRVQQDLHGPRGEINGAMLDNGMTLKLPPPAAEQMASLLQPGQPITAQGWAFSNAYGKVMDVQAIGASPEQLSLIASPPPRGGPGKHREPPPPPGLRAPPPAGPVSANSAPPPPPQGAPLPPSASSAATNSAPPPAPPAQAAPPPPSPATGR